MKTAIMACMKNEAMFVLEWVAYHHLIGFDDIFICTNDCTDGTDEICDLLGQIGVVTHIRNGDRGGLTPQPAGVAKVLSHPRVAECRWLLHIDADEFLNILYGDGFLRDWLPTVDDFDAVAVSWRTFGDNGLREWPGGLQIEQLTAANARLEGYLAHHKTMFRPQVFGSGIDHMPKDPRQPGLRLCSAFGRELNADALYDPELTHHGLSGDRANRPRWFRWEGAMINHYAIRADDVFALKTARGNGIKKSSGGRYHLGSRWYRRANCNDVEETTIQRHLPALKRKIAQWRDQVPALTPIETAALAELRRNRDAG